MIEVFQSIFHKISKFISQERQARASSSAGLKLKRAKSKFKVIDFAQNGEMNNFHLDAIIKCTRIT